MSVSDILLANKTLNLKVQLEGCSTGKAIIASGERKPGEALTFHAYSDRMKASVLDSLASGIPFVVSVCDDPPHGGEWFEPVVKKPSTPILNAMINEPFEKGSNKG